MDAEMLVPIATKDSDLVPLSHLLSARDTTSGRQQYHEPRTRLGRRREGRNQPEAPSPWA